MELAGVVDDAAVDGVAGSSLACLLAPADDAETPWSKSGSSSYGVGANSGATKDTGQYDRRLSGSSGSTPGSGYRSGSSSCGGSGSGYHRDLSSDRKYGSQLDPPAGRDHSSTRTGSYSDTKYGTYPHRSRADASHGPPVTLPPTTSSGRRSRDPSPSTETPGGSSTLPLQLQLRMLSHRPSYSRSTSRESAPTSPSTSSPGSSRFSSATLPRSPHADKPAPVFGRTDDSASTDRERTSSYTPYSARSRNEERSPYLSSLLSSKSDERPSRAEERPSGSPYRPPLLGSSPSLGSTSARTRPEERSPYRTSNSTDSRALGPTASYLSHTNGPLRSRLDNSTATTASREDKTNTTTTNKVQDGKADEESSSEEEESETEESESESSEEEEDAKQKAVRRRPSQTVFVTVVSRGTSPTPPSASPSPFLRSRRAELARVLERTVARPSAAARPRTQDCGVQSDRGDDTSRTSRFAGASRPSPWTSYLDRYSSSRYSSGSGSSRVGGYSLASSSPRTSASLSSDSLASNVTSAAKSPSAPSVSGDSAQDSTKDKDKDKDKAAAASSASAPSTPSAEAPSKGVTRAISFKSLPRTRTSPDSKDENGTSSPSGSATASAAEAGKPPALSRAASSRNVSSIIA
ncbi:dentin sialophosphoprotein-like [Schistocerca piceifrons]|uniref:dentin sialophosphoprotein-like n=1 Tax=Schistocerca piceifrons TaxID=274613 RepID=UPI001F5FDF09|nr:dentin sialophosphoprotein-like [Schistocerca piceifrons]